MNSLQLKNGHLVLSATLVENVFPNLSYVQLVYYPKEGYLLLAPSDDELFRSLHKTRPALMKDKNPRGDKSIHIREILLDNDIEPEDRDLNYVHDKEMNFLKVSL